MNRILMIALDYPPCQSAGVQRTEKFVQYLPSMGWEPIVLTAHNYVHNKISNQSKAPDGVVVRAHGLNAFKHLSFKGKHFEATTQPDRFGFWYYDAVRQGIKAITRYKPSIIWATFPHPTAFKIALKLKQKTGLPLVADFRDPFAGTNPYVQEHNPKGAKIDASIAKHADYFVFCTQNIANLYLKTYPCIDEARVRIITNGYNEEIFNLQQQHRNTTTTDSGREANKTITLLHSGALYGNGRNPNCLFEALAGVKKQQPDVSVNLVFRGVNEPSHEQRDVIAKLGLQECVHFKPAIAYADSIQEMLQADGLVLLQGEIFNNQVPGKAYEYLRSYKSILALTHKNGATASVLSPHKGVHLADMESVSEIEKAMLSLIFDDRQHKRDIEQYNRRSTAVELATLLNHIQQTQCVPAEMK